MINPVVSIILPVFNGESWLEQSIRSALDQVERDIDLIVLDDGSTDATPEILSKISAQDPRVRIVTGSHRGLVANLNDGLDLATGRYIARLDADDWWSPERLSRQIAFMEANPDYGLLGSAIDKADESGRPLSPAIRPESDLMIRWKALLWCPFTHSSVLIRRSILERHGLRYKPEREGAEDYDLWVRLLQVTRGYNLPDRLVTKRIHESFSTSLAGQIAPTRTQISKEAMAIWAPGFSATSARTLDLYRVFHHMGKPQFKGYDERETLRISGDLLDLFAAFSAQQGHPAGLSAVIDFEVPRLKRAFNLEAEHASRIKLAVRIEKLRPGFIKLQVKKYRDRRVKEVKRKVKSWFRATC